VALGVVGMFLLGVAVAMRSGDPRWLLASLPFAVVLFVIGRYAPSGYRLAADGVHVERRAGPKLIPYRGIRSVDRVERPLGGLGVIASAGVFGRFGRYWNPRLGVHRLYLANRDTVVWLDTDGGWIALSPDRPDEFVPRLRARI
jgi:hypothetical protein